MHLFSSAACWWRGPVPGGGRGAQQVREPGEPRPEQPRRSGPESGVSESSSPWRRNVKIPEEERRLPRQIHPWAAGEQREKKASSVLRKEYKCWPIKTVDCPIPAIPDLEEYSDSSSSHLEIMMSIYFNSQNFHKIILNSFKSNLESYNNQRNIAFSTF